MDGLTYRLGLFHSLFDKALLSATEGLRANGKVLNLMALSLDKEGCSWLPRSRNSESIQDYEITMKLHAELDC